MLEECVASLTIGKTKRGSKRNQREVADSDDESESEGDQLVCNMTGERWEELPFLVIIDSGACASVMPTEWCPHAQITDTPRPKARELFRAANGHKIYNEGQKCVTMMTKEGTKRDMKFTVCEASKAFSSVSQMCNMGHRVIFIPPWSGEGPYREYPDIGEKMWLEQKGGLYILNAKVAPRHRQTSRQQQSGGAATTD